VSGADGAYLLEAKPDLKPAVARFLGGSSTTSVEVLNAAGVSGLAARTADRLAQNGFVVASVGDAPRPQSQTTILAGPGARPAAEAVARALSLPTSRVSDATLTSGRADVQVILGSDAR
jgi:hypothetical protein